MLPRLPFKNGKELLSGFYFIASNRIKLRRNKEYMPLQRVVSPNDNLTENSWKNKIIYNEVIYKRKMLLFQETLRKKIEYVQKCKDDGVPPATSAVFLRYVGDNNDKPVETIKKAESEKFHFPFDVTKNFVIDNPNNQESHTDDHTQVTNPAYDTQLSFKRKVLFEDPKRWMEEAVSDVITIDNRFGTCNPDLPASNVPCGGCGALLHCTNMTVPGFIPKENFEGLSEVELRAQLCQRCIFLKEYDVALGVTVNEEDYTKIISQLKDKKVLILLLVDLLDFPCSILPNILDFVGKNKPLFVIGNKLDLLIDDGKDFVKHRKELLVDALEDFGIREGNVKHVELISAKTGYGIEKLITAIHSKWGDAGDVYIVGCTNAGKSTLFNALIQSDFCKSKATDLLQRATVSQWPGTTLNLLKFPILRACSWRTALRMQRLKVEKKQEEVLRRLKQVSLQSHKGKRHQLTLMGFIGQTFPNNEESKNQIGLDPEDYNFKFGKWCYDTPGVVHEAQILKLLTTFELSKVLPIKPIVPRNFKLKAGNTLFIAGLARLDFLEGNVPVWFTVYASSDLPITITYVQDADFIYQKLLGTDEFAVPRGNAERMGKWPELMSRDLKVYGVYKNTGGADIVLSSAGSVSQENYRQYKSPTYSQHSPLVNAEKQVGWVSVSPSPSSSCKLRAWTPDGRGIFLRRSNLIRSGWRYKGNKIRGTPAYETSIKIVDDVKMKF